jgi:nucleoside-diphosphate-sugar epimerase
MKILVTGGSGKVGWHVVQELARGHEIRIFSSRPPEEGPHQARSGHEFIKGDLLDPESLRRALDGVEAVAHLAAKPWISPATFHNNAVGTYNLLEACRAAGLKRFVMAGSDWGVGKAYGALHVPESIPVLEADPSRPHDNYGLSKVVNEVTCEMYGREYGMEIANLRLTAVWMPEETDGYRAKGVAGLPATIEENSKYWWTYVDVRDVSSAFRLALEARILPAYGAYFCSAKDTMIDMPTMEAVRKYWPAVKVRNEVPGFDSVLSIEAAKKVFGWEPSHSWRGK